MGVTGSHMSCLSNWWPMSDGVQERLQSMEQKQTTVESTQLVLDRKYSELDVNYELLQQYVRTSQHDIKHILIRLDCAEQKIATLTKQQNEMADTDMIILRK